ncbi:MarR family transcriptional regulator [Paractinoplanes deccanensis]|uniref:MarR family transcriptional regulator n=1 Tax=Paractinoplanes deccanensis TaxID=113561 RepID=A0ABQ3YKG3_9ACTN|nr:MarR family winged helix-turn-helix transcriptional regulator [Actinoplanes deccanensis]GID80437.1 MarR family transcriptional regulator [Actinoplanes deccanensis]
MSAGQTLFEFVRHWSRRTAAEADRGRDVQVTEAVHALRGLGEITVNDVAAELGIDQSGASRMIAHATAEGYLTAAPSLQDARRRTISVTPAGAELLEAAHAWQEAVFADLTATWTGTERADFHRALRRLLDTSRARITAAATPGSSSARRAAR